MEEERAYAEAQHASEDDDEKKSGRHAVVAAAPRRQMPSRTMPWRPAS